MMSESADRVDDVRRIIMKHLPSYTITSVDYLDEGMDNTTFEVNGELVVRFAKDSNIVTRGGQVSREANLLAAVATVSTVPVPEPVFVDPDEGCLAYKKLLGSALIDLPGPQRGVHATALAAELGKFLTSIHGILIARVHQFANLDVVSLSEYLSEATEFYDGMKQTFSVAQQRAVELFFDEPLPDVAYTAVLCHNDLSVDHILVDPSTWRVTGIIDWTDAAITDPAYDFALIYRDLGPEALEAALGNYTSTVNDVTVNDVTVNDVTVNDANEMRQRAMFVARCKLFEDLNYGTDHSMAALEWLFPS